MAYLSIVPQKIASTNDVEIVTSSEHERISMITLANIHGTNAVAVDLYIETTTGDTDHIVDSGANVIQEVAPTGYAVTGGSQAIVMDGTAATSDGFLNKKIYKSDGTLFGTCTTFTNGTNITFSGGIENAIADNDSLYTPTKYYIIKDVDIPAGATLKLEANEINFDQDRFSLWINCTVANVVDVITRPN